MGNVAPSVRLSQEAGVPPAVQELAFASLRSPLPFLRVLCGFA